MKRCAFYRLSKAAVSAQPTGNPVRDISSRANGVTYAKPPPVVGGGLYLAQRRAEHRRTTRFSRRRFILVKELLHVPRFGGTSRRMAREIFATRSHFSIRSSAALGR